LLLLGPITFSDKMDKFIKKGQILKYQKSGTCWLSNAPAIVIKKMFFGTPDYQAITRF